MSIPPFFGVQNPFLAKKNWRFHSFCHFVIGGFYEILKISKFTWIAKRKLWKLSRFSNLNVIFQLFPNKWANLSPKKPHFSKSGKKNRKSAISKMPSFPTEIRNLGLSSIANQKKKSKIFFWKIWKFQKNFFLIKSSDWAKICTVDVVCYGLSTVQISAGSGKNNFKKFLWIGQFFRKNLLHIFAFTDTLK